MSVQTPADLADKFTYDSKESSSERLARFLNELAEVLPFRFADRRVCAKVAFIQKRTPGEDSDWVKGKLPALYGRTKKRLREEYNRELWADRLYGIRASVDDNDKVSTVHRAGRRRVVAAIRSLELVDGSVNASHVKADLRKELLAARKAQESLKAYVEKVPLLLPARIDSEEK